MFSSIGEKTLYIFAISNLITIPMVWALYPESNQRTLEEMDLGCREEIRNVER
jgi:hypothetical protein